MNIHQLNKELEHLFQEEMGLKVPDVKTDLIEAGFLDSLRFTHLLAAIEERYDMVVSIEDLEIENFKSIESIAKYVHNFENSKQSVSDKS